MTYNQKQDIALFRYGIIAPLVTGSLPDPSKKKSAFFREAAAKTHTGPDGNPVTLSASTIEKWHRSYQREGFNGLLPKSRSDEGASRSLDGDLKEKIRYFKKEHPQMTAAGIYRALIADGSLHSGQSSVSSVERFLRRIRTGEGESTNKDMRRYELPHINAVWYGDTCFGPWMKTSEGKKGCTSSP